ncbi:MAG: FkbM family methyltransferase [Phycisphaerales bacterium]|nr:FkbM family methyltransferase [Phycisphaerales bacterium]
MGGLRSMAERFSRGRSFRRHLPADFNRTPFIVTPDAALSYLKPDEAAYDMDLLRFALEYVKPGHVVWDIGANIGVFTFAAAYLAGANGSVLAVEADIWLATLLNRSRQLPANRDLHVDILPAAISDRAGLAKFHIAARGRASNALADVGGRSQMGGTRETQLVPTITIDGLLDDMPMPNVVKIDIEGAEVLALRSATRVLREGRPVLYCEVGEQQNADVTAILRDAGYTLYDGNAPTADRVELDRCAANTLAVPTA